MSLKRLPSIVSAAHLKQDSRKRRKCKHLSYWGADPEELSLLLAEVPNVLMNIIFAYGALPITGEPDGRTTSNLPTRFFSLLESEVHLDGRHIFWWNSGLLESRRWDVDNSPWKTFPHCKRGREFIGCSNGHVLFIEDKSPGIIAVVYNLGTNERVWTIPVTDKVHGFVVAVDTLVIIDGQQTRAYDRMGQCRWVITDGSETGLGWNGEYLFGYNCTDASLCMIDPVNGVVKPLSPCSFDHHIRAILFLGDEYYMLDVEEDRTFVYVFDIKNGEYQRSWGINQEALDMSILEDCQGSRMVVLCESGDLLLYR